MLFQRYRNLSRFLPVITACAPVLSFTSVRRCRLSSLLKRVRATRNRSVGVSGRFCFRVLRPDGKVVLGHVDARRVRGAG
jgi:hypothetical protein